jgi:uncharacterized protein YjiS (DUF1127 family)
MVIPAPGRTPALPAPDVCPPTSSSRLTALVARFSTWRERYRQRRHLSGLSTYMLKDIGLTRADVELEFRKLPWQE